MASATAFPRSVVVLYRNILTAHRGLPANHRALGDKYVKEEFRRHKGERPPPLRLPSPPPPLPSPLVAFRAARCKFRVVAFRHCLERLS